MNTVSKILIVDDDPVVRETLSGLLGTEDVELFFAENGQACLEQARAVQPDVILLDVMMPGMDGYETCRQIRIQPNLAEVPVIMITALDDRESLLTGLKAGADDFLSKPFDGLELQIRIRNIMRLNRYHNLAAERARFFWVIENAEKGYLILNDRGRIQYANRRAKTYLHLTEAYTGADFLQQVEKHYVRHEAGPVPSGFLPGVAGLLVQPETAVAAAFWLQVEFLETGVNLKDQHLISVSDVTAEMIKRQDGSMIHLVAHKLRNPMVHIYSGMELLNSSMESMPAEEMRSIIRYAWEGARRFVTDVNNILKFLDEPRTLAGGSPLHLSGFRTMVSSTCEMLDIKQAEVSIPPLLERAELFIPARAMELILYELLENSQKFHPQHQPQISVRVGRAETDQARITFLDDGQSMTADQIGRAILPFAQGEKWFTGELPGMGLGIPLVASLVWQAGGKMTISNRDDGPGIQITLMIPILDPGPRPEGGRQ